MTPSTSTQTTDLAALLRSRVAGSVFTPHDDAYDDARALWNGTIDRRPALIVQCMDVHDVVACVRTAREAGVPLSVRGGGHNVAGSALVDGGLVIDLRRMNTVIVDADARRVQAGGGATIGDVDRATQLFGLAAPLGVMTETGIAGLTLGGGLGWLRRLHGLSCDALRSAQVVTADGQVLEVSPEAHADLFWAIRGGGGNFGVVTRFDYALYDVGPEVFLLATFYPAAQAQAVVQRLQTFMETAPDAFSPIGVFGHLPAEEPFPAEHAGTPFFALVGPYIGDVDEGAHVLDGLRRLATPLVDFSGVQPFLDVQQFFDADYPNGGRYYWTSAHLRTLTPDVVDRLLALNEAAPSPHSTLDLWFQGGAMGRVSASATAFGTRYAPVLVGIEANWHDAQGDDANTAWGRQCFAALQPFSDGSLYANFPGALGEHEAGLAASYGANADRLARVKRRYDPDDVFRTHQRVRLAPAS